MKNRFVQLFAGVALLFGLASCGEWTETESIGLADTDIETQNPELYARYVENLNRYKQSAHKIVYATFDNSVKEPANRSHYMSLVPDSIDMVELEYPDGLVPREVEEIEKLHSLGTKVLFRVAFETVEADYEAYLAAWNEANPEPGEGISPLAFVDFMRDELEAKLSLFDRYDYDGVTIRYVGMDYLFLKPAELAVYTERQTLFLDTFKNWKAANPGRLLIFEGQPHTLVDKSYTQEYDYLILDSSEDESLATLTYHLQKAMCEGVPTDRFLAATSTTSLDPQDVTTGYFSNSGSSDPIEALPLVAQWTACEHLGVMPAGMVIRRVQNDYFQMNHSYGRVRKAIDTINPSPKY